MNWALDKGPLLGDRLSRCRVSAVAAVKRRERGGNPKDKTHSAAHLG